MAGDDQARGGDAQDLLGRWLAHHEGRAPEDDEPVAADEPTAPVPDPVPTPAAPAPVNELDREPPPGWEPVLLRSVRVREEQQSRLLDPEPGDRSIEAEVLAAVARPRPAPAPAPTTAPEPVAPPAPAPEPAVEVVGVPEPMRPLEETIRAAVASVARPEPVARPRGPVAGDAARDLLAESRERARAVAAASARTSVLPAVAAAPATPATPATPAAPETAPKAAPGPVVVREEMPALYTFRPKRAARWIMTAVLVGALALTAYAVHEAWLARDTRSIGLAAIAAVATGVVWAIRAGTTPARLVVRQGQLEVTRQGGRYVFDLSSTFTLIEVQGHPGRRGWQVVFPRRGMSPFTVDASIVDPHDFMRVLRFHRPNLGA